MANLGNRNHPRGKGLTFAIDCKGVPGRGDRHHSGSKPVVRLVAVSQALGPRKPGALKGKLFFTPDVFAPLTDAEMKELGFE